MTILNTVKCCGRQSVIHVPKASSQIVVLIRCARLPCSSELENLCCHYLTHAWNHFAFSMTVILKYNLTVSLTRTKMYTTQLVKQNIFFDLSFWSFHPFVYRYLPSYNFIYVFIYCIKSRLSWSLVISRRLYSFSAEKNFWHYDHAWLNTSHMILCIHEKLSR